MNTTANITRHSVLDEFTAVVGWGLPGQSDSAAQVASRGLKEDGNLSWDVGSDHFCDTREVELIIKESVLGLKQVVGSDAEGVGCPWDQTSKRVSVGAVCDIYSWLDETTLIATVVLQVIPKDS